jgi:hypothetical protein
MASPNSRVDQFVSDGFLTHLRDKGFLGGADQANLEVAHANVRAPADPVARDKLIQKTKNRLEIERVVDHMLGSTYGHVLEHHCLTSFSTALDPRTVLSAFRNLPRGASSINKVTIGVGNAYKAYKKPKRQVGPVSPATPAGPATHKTTPETVLRCRVIGLDLDLLTLPEQPRKCTACAFTSRTSATAAARSMTFAFLGHIQKKENATKTGKIEGTEMTVVYDPHLKGYAVVAPITALGQDVASGVVGFDSGFTLTQITHTIQRLLEDLKPDKKDKDDWEKLLMLVLEAVTVPIERGR